MKLAQKTGYLKLGPDEGASIPLVVEIIVRVP